MKNRITIHDLAKILKMDSSTVSRALADSPRVKAKTKELIKQKAKELGYSRNVIASNLRSKKSKIIGVIVPRISRHFFSTVISGIEEMAFEKGYQVIICQSHDNLERERELVDTLISYQIDGLLISISMETNEYDHLQKLEDGGMPVVFFDRRCTSLKNAVNVQIDDFGMAARATDYLFDQGYQRIAHFTGDRDISIYKDRLEGFKSAHAKRGAPLDESLIFESGLLPKDGQMLVDKILALPDRPEAIFAANDVAAIAAIKRLQEQNIKVPGDIGVVGFSNEPVSEYTSPQLSTIDQNPYKMGEMAMQQLLHLMDNGKGSDQPIVIASDLIVRESASRK